MADSADEQIAAARDLLADGVSRQGAAEALQAQFGVSQATAYRRVSAAAAIIGGDDPGPDGSGGAVDLSREALLTMLRLMRQAEADGDATEAMRRAQILASSVARLRLNRLQF